MSKSFFEGKRPWSLIKDQVLRSYMPAYLAKIALLRRPILLIDAFAGPGNFGDNEAGSPLIICDAAQEKVAGKYLAIFVNQERDYHQHLSDLLKSQINQGSVIAIHGNAEAFLDQIHHILTDQTVFLYLDPFGLKGCEFSHLEPFIRRNKKYSTEIVINISAPTIHRLTTANAHRENKTSSQILSLNRRLTSVLGGDYWEEVMWNYQLEPEVKTQRIIKMYCENIANMGLSYTGFCPVRERLGGEIKYYITFASRHPHATLLMNDAMCRAYNERMHRIEYAGTLFENDDWKNYRDNQELHNVVDESIKKQPGINRDDLWLIIVQNHFMRFTQSEFRKAVKKQIDKTIKFTDTTGTGRLNGSSKLFPILSHDS